MGVNAAGLEYSKSQSPRSSRSGNHKTLRERAADLATSIIVAALLFGVLTPIGAILRLLGRDALHLKRARQAPTYWIIRQPPGPAPQTMTEEF